VGFEELIEIYYNRKPNLIINYENVVTKEYYNQLSNVLTNMLKFQIKVISEILEKTRKTNKASDKYEIIEEGIDLIHRRNGDIIDNNHQYPKGTKVLIKTKGETNKSI
jgi:hypothetical protein